jgi:hypothetical protein
MCPPPGTWPRTSGSRDLGCSSPWLVKWRSRVLERESERGDSGALIPSVGSRGDREIRVVKGFDHHFLL